MSVKDVLHWPRFRCCHSLTNESDEGQWFELSFIARFFSSAIDLLSCIMQVEHSLSFWQGADVGRETGSLGGSLMRHVQVSEHLRYSGRKRREPPSRMQLQMNTSPTLKLPFHLQREHRRPEQRCGRIVWESADRSPETIDISKNSNFFSNVGKCMQSLHGPVLLTRQRHRHMTCVVFHRNVASLEVAPIVVITFWSWSIHVSFFYDSGRVNNLWKGKYPLLKRIWSVYCLTPYRGFSRRYFYERGTTIKWRGICRHNVCVLSGRAEKNSVRKKNCNERESNPQPTLLP